MRLEFDVNFLRNKCSNDHVLFQECYLLSHFYYKYCSIKRTGLINCTGFLLSVLVSEFFLVLTAKRTVSIKRTGFEGQKYLY